jgi:hypothetical protein
MGRERSSLDRRAKRKRAEHETRPLFGASVASTPSRSFSQKRGKEETKKEEGTGAQRLAAFIARSDVFIQPAWTNRVREAQVGRHAE